MKDRKAHAVRTPFTRQYVPFRYVKEHLLQYDGAPQHNPLNANDKLNIKKDDGTKTPYGINLYLCKG